MAYSLQLPKYPSIHYVSTDLSAERQRANEDEVNFCGSTKKVDGSVGLWTANVLCLGVATFSKHHLEADDSEEKKGRGRNILAIVL